MSDFNSKPYFGIGLVPQSDRATSGSKTSSNRKTPK